jgi:C1A family cysteine protease
MKTSSLNKKYGWVPSLPSHQDHKFSAILAPSALPPFVDLRKHFPSVYNQLDLGSCTANAAAGAMEFDQIKQNTKIFTPSRLFIYYNERVIENTVSSDSGASLKDSVTAVAKWGAPPETLWPYIESQFTVKPPTTAYTAGLLNKAISYTSVNQDQNTMSSVLAGGYPFVLGFTVYDSFESDEVAKTGIVPMPGTNEDELGGHAVVAVGYNNSNATIDGVPARTFIIRNSWGPEWGVDGYCFMPFGYLLNDNLADDFWTIKQIN